VPPLLRPDALAGRLVLVVDDLPINRAILRRQLAAFGALCVEAESGEAALAALAAADRAGSAVDLVLLDQMMPGTSGDAVAVAIRGHAEWLQPKIVLISSAGVSPSEAAALDSRLDRILLKPVRQHELFECLARLFGALPASRAPLPVTAPAAVAGGGTAHLLLVEDHAINREVARAVLERFGYTVDMAEDGVAALAAVQDGIYELVLMDVQMPRLDGLEATRQIRALGDGFARIPIIAMTANAMQGDAARCFEAGMNDYIAKPIDPEEVRAKLVYWLAATRRTSRATA
jgi:CheY-like chemotaxis protein